MSEYEGKYGQMIQKYIRQIESHNPEDYVIIARYREFKGRYEAAVIDGSSNMDEPIATLYAKKEAYRKIANARGVSIDELVFGKGEKDQNSYE